MDYRAFIAGLPKAELHLHLEGSLEPDLMFTLARRNGVELPWESPEQARAAYEFDDLQSFLNLFYQAERVLRHEQDFYDLTYAYLKRVRADNVVHAEVFLGPQSFVEHGVDLAEIMNGVLSAIDNARGGLDMSAALLVSAQRHRTESAAFELLDSVRPWGDRILGFGLGGAEVGNPPAKFARYFAECRRQGFPVTAHAGEEGPASYVREALDVLGVNRIDHGKAAVDDPGLVRELVEREIPLTVCPVSNVQLKVVDTVAAHPLPAMLKSGLRATINSDDPAFFGSYVNDNFWRCHDELGLSEADLVTLARNSFLGSFLPEDQAVRLAASVDEYAATFR
jgi:adenine deaminase